MDGKYFTVEELCKSDKARKYKIKNVPTEKVKANLRCLIKNVLDPLREWYGKPISPTSGYRCEELNEIVGGKPNSYHLTGCACDINMGSKAENKKIFDYISQNLPFTELGWEGGGVWVHVGFIEGRDEKEIFYA